MKIQPKDILTYTSREYDIIEYYIVFKVDDFYIYTRNSLGQEESITRNCCDHMKVLKYKTEEWQKAKTIFLSELSEYKNSVLAQINATEEILGSCE